MDSKSEKRMWRNLVKGAALVAGGFVVVIALDHATGVFADTPDESAGWEDGECFGDEYVYPQADGFISAVFDGDYSDFGAEEGVPSDFASECFSPAMVGEAYFVEDGPTVGFVSRDAAGDVHDLCSEALQAHGWIRVESGQSLQSSFVKGSGRYRWLFLESTPLADASSVVVVLHEEAA